MNNLNVLVVEAKNTIIGTVCLFQDLSKLLFAFSRYKERMIKIKELNEDKPYDILDNVIWWTEFVIRHKGAPHLRTSIAYDPWYQRYDMDIIAVLSITMFVIFVCILMIIHKLLIIFISNDMKKPVDPKKKIN